MQACRNLKWHLDVDVVVLGYGGAGAVAAITANDAGAKVLILEKQPAEKHLTNTGMSGGIILSPDSANDAAR